MDSRFLCPIRGRVNKCSVCGENKTCEELKTYHDRLHNHSLVCKGCHNARCRSVWQRQKRIIYQRKYKLFRKYGITLSDYAAMAMKQKDRCAICDKIPTPLHVDHCHKTGIVRGLLCGECNKALGLAGDNPERLRKMADYLEQSLSSMKE